MASTEIPAFSTPQEEILYWKKRVEDKQQEMDDLETSFNEFQDFSKQLEEEMEDELRICEKKCAELTSQNARLKNDQENIVDKLNTNNRESSKLINSLQDEVSKLTTLKQTLMEDRRKLEQENDSLERRERKSSASVLDLSDKLDKVMEENVWMQSELEESKLIADETIQRLRDDIRDLRHEISVRERKPTSGYKSNTGSNNSNGTAATQQTSSSSTTTTTTSEKSVITKRENPLSFNIPRAQKSQRQRTEDTASSSRASSLIVVSDLINLVTDLETRISNFKLKPNNNNSNNNNSNGTPTSSNNLQDLITPTSPLLKHQNSFTNLNDFIKSSSSSENININILNTTSSSTTTTSTTAGSLLSYFENTKNSFDINGTSIASNNSSLNNSPFKPINSNLNNTAINDFNSTLTTSTATATASINKENVQI